MSINYEREINALRERLEKARDLRIRTEARLEQLNKQKQEIHEELSRIGITPEQLEGEIARLRTEIGGLIRKANEMLPGDLTI